MTFGSLFAGIGGLDLGFERAGLRCVWQVEINPYCRKVLAKHWPDVPKWDDVRTFTGGDLERPDVICGGFPCQPVSTAGKRLGQKDPRWMWPDFARVLRLLRPRFVVIENTPGLFVRGFDAVLGDLAALGFDAEWATLPAAAIGAPHVRERLFVVAHAPGQRVRKLPAGRRPDGEGAGDPDRQGEGLDAHPGGPGLPAPQPARRGQPQEAEGILRGPVAKCDWWAAEPDVVRMVHGLPGRVDRIRGLGNSVVPQVAEWIGRRLMEAG